MKKLNLPFINNQILRTGSLLISDPFLDDPYFKRSVVLICEHSQESSFGFVLNNYTEHKYFPFSEIEPLKEIRLAIGGPVDHDKLFYIHNLGSKIPGAQKIKNGLYFGGDFDVLIELLKNEPIENIDTNISVRFFCGYSGWDEKQLDEEMQEHSWIAVNNIPNEIILSTNENQLWKKCLALQGDKFELISNFPLNPLDN
jgi:putative transcriptional regulator